MPNFVEWSESRCNRTKKEYVGVRFCGFGGTMEYFRLPQEAVLVVNRSDGRFEGAQMYTAGKKVPKNLSKMRV